MRNHEEVGGYKIPELKVEGEVYNELQQDKELDKLSDELEQKARAAERIDEVMPEKSWAEQMAEVGEFNKEKAEEAAEQDKLAPEELEKGSTRAYEAEIFALDKFADNADILDEPIEMPTETDFIKEWAEKGHLEQNADAVQDWLHSKELSPADEEYRKTLLKSGVVKKKLIFRPSEDLDKFWKEQQENRVSKIRQERQKEFLDEQDRIERDFRYKIRGYEPSLENAVANYQGAPEDVPMPSRLELVHEWIEDNQEGEPVHADLILDWLESEEGSEQEKRYRALTNAKLSGKIKRFDVEPGSDRATGKLVERTIDCLRIHCYAYGSTKEREAFIDKLKSGKESEEFASLSDEEKETKWKEAEKEYRDKIAKREISRKETMRKRNDYYSSRAEKSKNKSSEAGATERKTSEKKDDDEEWRQRLLDDTQMDIVEYPNPLDFVA